MTDAAGVLAHALGRPATLGTGRLICIDGPSGSGKSTLARQIAGLTAATIVHTDDLCPGWDGLGALPELLVGLVAPLSQGAFGSYPRYDWITGATAEEVLVAPSPLLIVEGVGAGARLLALWRTTLVWTDAEPGLRRTRAVTRDGEYFEKFWDDWARAESAFFAVDAVAENADLTITT